MVVISLRSIPKPLLRHIFGTLVFVSQNSLYEWSKHHKQLKCCLYDDKSMTHKKEWQQRNWERTFNYRKKQKMSRNQCALGILAE
jgi:hypothetical protein